MCVAAYGSDISLWRPWPAPLAHRLREGGGGLIGRQAERLRGPRRRLFVGEVGKAGNPHEGPRPSVRPGRSVALRSISPATQSAWTASATPKPNERGGDPKWVAPRIPDPPRGSAVIASPEAVRPPATPSACARVSQSPDRVIRTEHAHACNGRGSVRETASRRFLPGRGCSYGW